VRGIFDFIVQPSPPSYPDPEYRQRWSLIVRGLEVLDAQQIQKNAEANILKNDLARYKQQMIQAHPELARPAPRPIAVVPWEDAWPIVQISDFEQFKRLKKLFVAGQTLYALGVEEKEQDTVLHLLRVPLRGLLPQKRVEMLGKFEVTRLPNKPPFWKPEHVHSALGKDHVWLGTLTDGIVEFDLGTKTARQLTKGLDLPSQKVTSLAWLDGKLYGGLEGGCLLALDPKSGKFELLASSRRKGQQSPFDDGELLHVPFVLADPQRQRLLFLLHQRPKYLSYSALTPMPREPTNGLWEYHVPTGKFKKHVDLFWHSLTTGHLSEKDRLLLRGQYSTMSFDLAKNEARLLHSTFPAGPSLPVEKALSSEWFYPAGTPQLERAGWLWSSEPFARLSLTQRRRDLLPSPVQGKEQEPFTASDGIELLSPDELLVGDGQGYWILKLKKEPQPEK
jgi:hypothetical protein